MDKDLLEKKRLRYEKAKATRLKNDPDAYRKMGAKGGSKTTNRPFRDRELARKAGLISGQKRRNKTVEK